MYSEMLASMGLVNVITDHTRVDHKKGTKTLIDHILVKKIEEQLNSIIIESEISDHFPIIFFEKCKINQESKKLFKNYVCNSKVSQLIEEEDWKILLEEGDTDRLYNKLKSKLEDIYKKATLNQKATINKRKTNDWMTPSLVADCKQRDILYKRWKNNYKNVQYEKEYKAFRNLINKKIQTQKSNYFKNKFIQLKNDPRKTWNLINEILGKKKANIDDTVCKTFNTDACVLANKFADFFKSQTLNILHMCNSITSNNINVTLENSIFTHATNISEIVNIIGGLSSHKSPGIDGIRAADIKNHVQIFAPIITKIINNSVTYATIPASLKTAVIRPIYKGGNKIQLNNYRPIAILPFIEKCMEEVIVRRLNDFIEKHSLIHQNQYGFQKNKSTGKLLGEFANCINESLDKSHHVLVLFMDFSKAFDTLNHKKLLDALKRVGIRGVMADWLFSYLSNRTICVKIKDELSEKQNMKYGVPQGSKLGPLLFILYTNELLRIFKQCIPFAFADDTAIVVRNRSLDTALTLMQEEFNAAVKWCHDNGLVINALKTKMMHIRSPHFKATEKRVYLENELCPSSIKQTIELVETYKYLGVVIDSHFLWKEHIEKLRADLKKSLFALAHLRFYSSQEVLKQVYFALVESRIRYGILAWGNASKTHIDKIQKLQSAALKLINNNNHVNFSVLKVDDIFKMSIIIEYCDDNRFIHPIQHDVNTRRRALGMLQIPRNYNTYGRRKLQCNVPSIINQLPRELICIHNLKKRKKQLKQYFLNNNIIRN